MFSPRWQNKLRDHEVLSVIFHPLLQRPQFLSAHISISPGVVKARMGQIGIIFSWRYLLTMKEVMLGLRPGHRISLRTYLEKLRFFTEKSISKYMQNYSTGNIIKCQWMRYRKCPRKKCFHQRISSTS